MPSKLQELKRKALAENLAELEKKFLAVSNQLSSTLNAGDKIPLQKQLELIEAEIEETEQALTTLDAQSQNANRQYLDFEDKIHRLDYSEVRTLLDGTVKQSRKEGSLGLFLLHNGNALGGRWCLDLIRKELKEATNDFKHFEIGFIKQDKLDEFVMLDRLAGKLNIEAVTHDAEAYAKEVIRKICGSLQLGSVVLIEVHQWDYFAQQQQMLTWFVEKFWLQLVCEFKASQTHRNVKVMAVLVADSTIPDNCWQVHCCGENDVASEKLALLPLRHWKRDEVEDWISNYGGVNWNEQKLTQMTDLIFNASSGGFPSLIYQALITHLKG